MEVVVTTAVISRAKLQSNHHYQQTNTVFLQADAFLLPNQQCQSTEGKPSQTNRYKTQIIKRKHKITKHNHSGRTDTHAEEKNLEWQRQPGLVAIYNIQPRNRSSQFSHRATITLTTEIMMTTTTERLAPITEKLQKKINSSLSVGGQLRWLLDVLSAASRCWSADESNAGNNVPGAFGIGGTAGNTPVGLHKIN